jgi:choline dehydrogenase
VSERPDFLIVGGGTAGCVLADRLSADGRHRVTLLEWGGEDRNPWIHIPIGYGKLASHPRLSTRFTSEPERGLHERRITIPRGRVLGGCSSTNGLLYVRGQPEDYDGWAAAGNAGWSYADVLPYFRRAEDYHGGADDVHGAGGPIAVSPPAAPHALAEAFIAAGGAQGLPRRADFNGAEQEGIGYYDMTTRRVRRSSTATGYLRRARRRANLRVVTGAQVLRVLFEGKRAIGVEYRRDGAVHRLETAREVILAAGAIASPHLLLRSGVGAGAALRDLGIAVVHDLPSVGANLVDHANVRMNYRAKQPITINDRLGSMFGQAVAGLEYLLRGTGPLTVSAGFGAAFYRTRPELDRPDFQGYLLLFRSDASGTRLEPFSGFMTSGYQMRPESRGSVSLASPNPAAAPHIRLNLLATEVDQRVTLAGVKRLRAILRAPEMAELVGESEPGDEVSDTELLDYIRANASTGHHVAGSCRMGTGADAVVDPRLAVHGIAGLRVVDASIMPAITSGNTCAPVVMIAEKAADLILEDNQ